MKNFLAVYTGTPASIENSGWNSLNEEARRARENAGIEAWQKWAQDNSDFIVSGGGPLGKTKRVSASGIVDTTNELCAYTVVRAESQEAAAKLFENHPHFSIFPGDAVEIMECLPIPGMQQ
jgi:hypothetical protein